jgi:signal transduction histidine kinase
MGLHKKFILCFAAIAFLTIGFFSWQNFRINKEQIRDNRRGKIELLNEIINNGLKSLMLEGRGREFQKFLENLIAEDIVAIRIFTEDGMILNSTVPGEIGQRFQHKDRSVLQARNDLSLFSTDGGKGKKVFSKIVLIRNDRLCQRCHGGVEHIRGMLDVEFASRGTDNDIAETARGITRTALITLTLLAGSIWLLSRYLVKRPLEELISSIEKVAGGDMREQLSTNRNDEIGRLASNLNAIMADIDRKRAEIDKCRADRDVYVEKMASLGELAASVAHDIKNPLAGISGALQVLAEDFPEDSPRKDITREILDEIDRLDGAVKDLLLFARPPDMHLIPVNINAIIEKVMAKVTQRAGELKVGIDLLAAEVPAVMVDPEQLERAFGNIALHSLESMPYGGQLKFAVHDSRQQNEIEITVSDTGPGIPEDNLKDIFKPFFSSKHSGSGLGLAITRNIIEGHRGRIAVESAPGKGTRYRIILPKTG